MDCLLYSILCFIIAIAVNTFLRNKTVRKNSELFLALILKPWPLLMLSPILLDNFTASTTYAKTFPTLCTEIQTDILFIFNYHSRLSTFLQRTLPTKRGVDKLVNWQAT